MQGLFRAWRPVAIHAMAGLGIVAGIGLARADTLEGSLAEA
jgi:hypothetical protein